MSPTETMGFGPSVLLTDLYQLTMLQAYHDQGMEGTAVFEFFVRRLPEPRNFLMAAGLAQVLDFLEGLHFSSDELAWIRDSGRFGAAPAYPVTVSRQLHALAQQVDRRRARPGA